MNPNNGSNETLRQTVNDIFGPFLETCQSINHQLAEINETVVPSVALPNVVVIGCESSGKSSVLERLASLRFFPRGEDITTRMPIRLILKGMSEPELRAFAEAHQQPFSYHMIRVSNIDGSMQFAVVNSDLEEAVGDRMTAFIERQNGAANGIIRQEFVIEVYSTEVTDMNLVDLPGVVTAVRGNEPQSLPEETRNLVREYIQDPNNLLLVIVPCATRMNTYAMFALIQEFNAQSRCIGVLTKADECNANFITRQVNATAPGSIVLEPHGYVAVMNGSDRALPMSAITQQENDYFARAVGGGENEFLGLAALVEKIVQGFKLHVQGLAPTLRENLTAVSERVALRLMDLGMVVTDENIGEVKQRVMEKLRATNPDIKGICSAVIAESLTTSTGRYHSAQFLYRVILYRLAECKMIGIAEDNDLPTRFIRFRQLHESLHRFVGANLENRSMVALIDQFKFGKNMETARVHGGVTFNLLSFVIGIFTDFFNRNVIPVMNELAYGDLLLSDIETLFVEREKERSQRVSLEHVRTLINTARTQLEGIMSRRPDQPDGAFPNDEDNSDSGNGTGDLDNFGSRGRNIAVGHAYTADGELRDIETTATPERNNCSLPGAWNFAIGSSFLEQTDRTTPTPRNRHRSAETHQNTDAAPLS